jgi:hypothetical protein
VNVERSGKFEETVRLQSLANLGQRFALPGWHVVQIDTIFNQTLILSAHGHDLARVDVEVRTPITVRKVDGIHDIPERNWQSHVLVLDLVSRTVHDFAFCRRLPRCAT